MGATTSGTERFSLCLWTLFLKHVGNASKSFITLRIFFIPLAMQRARGLVFLADSDGLASAPAPGGRNFIFFIVWRGGGTNRSDAGLNLSGSWQQGHSATYNTPSRI